MRTKVVSGPRDCRAVFLSDTHLGSSASQVKKLLGFLKAHVADTYYLVGDVFDNYRDSKADWDTTYDILRWAATAAQNGSTFVYTPGNHDAHFLNLIGCYSPRFRIVTHTIHVGADGRKYLVLHGDCFDWAVRNAGWLATAAGWIDRQVRRGVDLMLGTEDDSYRHAKRFVRRVNAVVNSLVVGPRFADQRAALLQRHGADALICGHLHEPRIERNDELQVTYANSGDWLDSCSALVERRGGTLELVSWR